MNRSGYTLLEMLVVVLILSGLAAVGWPALRGTFEKAQLRDAAKQVAIELTKTRLQAIEKGQPQQFRFELEGTHWEAGPAVPLEFGQDLAAAINPESALPPRTGELPKGIRFLTPATVVQSPRADYGGEGNWSTPMIFQPQGRSGNARIRLASVKGLWIELDLRGLTGTATVGRIRAGEPVEP